MIRAILRTIREKWWLIGTGILLGFLARSLFGPTENKSGWHYSTELPATRPLPPDEPDFPLTLRKIENQQDK